MISIHSTLSLPCAAKLARRLLAAVVFLGFGAGGLASASAQLYTLVTDQSVFDAAAGSPTPFNFEGYNNTGSYVGTGYGSGPLTVDGVTFTDVNGGLQVNNHTTNGEANFTTDYLAGASGTITVTLPAGTTAFGADFAGYFYSGSSPLTLTVDGQATTPETTTIPGFESDAAFVGIVSATPFTTVVISVSGDAPTMNNVEYSSSPLPAPEPSTWAVLLCGVGVLGAVFRRRAQRA